MHFIDIASCLDTVQPFESYNRRFVSEAASLAFLASQGFDFNKCIYHGVPFMPMRTLNYRLTQARSVLGACTQTLATKRMLSIIMQAQCSTPTHCSASMCIHAAP